MQPRPKRPFNEVREESVTQQHGSLRWGELGEGVGTQQVGNGIKAQEGREECRYWWEHRRVLGGGHWHTVSEEADLEVVRQ